MSKKKILFITATHGDEKIGVDVITKINKRNREKGYDWIIANPKALRSGVRFNDSDLNRIFPGNAYGNYEERRASKIIRIGKKYDYVIDLHGSTLKTGIFIIITKFSLKNLKLALRFKIKRIVIWQNTKETIGSLSTFMPIGFEIEAGLKNDPNISGDLQKVIIDFLQNQNKKLNMNEELTKREIYVYCGKLSKNQKKPSNLSNWKLCGNYYPLFVDGQYKDVWCYKFKKMKRQRQIIKKSGKK